MLVHRRVTPNIKFAGSTHLYSWVERGTMRDKCLVKERNTMSLARALTQTARSRDDNANEGICGRHGGLMVSALDSGVTTW